MWYGIQVSIFVVVDFIVQEFFIVENIFDDFVGEQVFVFIFIGFEYYFNCGLEFGWNRDYEIC